MVTAMNEKACTACGLVLSFDNFASSKQGRFGLKSECRQCARKRDAAYRASRREALRQYKREWRATSPKAQNEKIYAAKNAEIVLARALQWQRDNPELAAARNSKRRAAKLRATPCWADHAAMRDIYSKARAMSVASGTQWHVDHTVPLQSKIVCGLHCEANLQILPGRENCSKKNSYWPDMP